MPEGTIKKLVTERGFGFIKTGSDKDVFFHHTAVVGKRFDDLAENDSVTFREEVGDKGPRAVDVTPV